MFKIYALSDWVWPGETPEVFGWYHIMWLFIMMLACVLVVLFLSKKHDDKIDEKLVFYVGAGLIILEIFKQIFKVLANGYYNWNDFPFQFCSVPMYVSFAVRFIKKEDIKETLYIFLASFGFLAGLAVMIYPGSVYNTDYIPMLIHTMIWHSSMVVVGIHLIISRGYGKKLKELVKPSILLFGLVTIALVVNIIAQGAYFGNPGNDYHGSFNLFYVSPFENCPLPILGDVIKDNVIFPVFFLSYLCAFTIGVLLVWLIIKLIRKCLKNI
jgi:uncharacterized membrane protein YwaF